MSGSISLGGKSVLTVAGLESAAGLVGSGSAAGSSPLQVPVLKLFPDVSHYPDWVSDFGTALRVLSHTFRDERMVEAVRAFLVEHDVPIDYAAVADEEIYLTGSSAQVGDAIMRSLFPVYLQLFPGELRNDGFYGFYPLKSSKAKVAAGERTLRGFVEALFGVYRKDLARLLTGGPQVYRVMWAANFAGHLPVEWLMDYVGSSRFSADTIFVDSDELAVFLGNFSLKEVRGFLWDEDCVDLLDCVRIFNALPVEKQVFPEDRSVRFLHDHFTLVSKGVGSDAVFVLPAEVARVDGRVVAGFTVNVLPDREQFLRTGEVMENCAGGINFFLGAVEGNLCLVRFDDAAGEPFALMELGWRAVPTADGVVGRWFVNQLFRARNEAVDDVFERAVKDFVSKEINDGYC